jgi:prepilin-type N-terminal cleavage/methylation domain-containing protein
LTHLNQRQSGTVGDIITAPPTHAVRLGETQSVTLWTDAVTFFVVGLPPRPTRLPSVEQPIAANPPVPGVQQFGTTFALAWAAMSRRRRITQRGMTLIELMVVVVIVGVLSTLAVYGVNKYMNSARAAEAGKVLNSIRINEELYKQETFVYLGSDDFTEKHPSDTPGSFKKAFDFPATPTGAAKTFQELGVETDGPVYFTYGVVAGRTGDSLPALPTAMSLSDLNYPATATEPYYIAFAQGDLNGDGVFSWVLAPSFTSELYVEKEGQ